MPAVPYFYLQGSKVPQLLGGYATSPRGAILERFRAKRAPIRVKKTRQNKNLELRFWFNRNRKYSTP
jgi:hypothetical protein